MIRPLRIRHRRMFAVLGLLLPVAFGLGVAARKPIPLRETPRMMQDFRATETLIWERNDLFPNVPVSIRLIRGLGYLAVDFAPSRGFAKPDLLVYWIPGNSTPTGKLPINAILLGPFTPTLPRQTPPDAEKVGGAIVLYSLGDSEIVDWSKPIPLSDTKQ